MIRMLVLAVASVLAMGQGAAARAAGVQDGTAGQSGTLGGGGAIRISPGVAAGALTQQVAPVYPPIAKAAHVGGVVILRAVISKAGTVENLEVVSGPPMLRSAAMDAVQKWTYRPYLLNGEPVEVETTINVNFMLANVGGADAPAVLKTATPETVAVAPSVLQGLAISEPGFASPDGAPEGAVVFLRVLVAKSGEVKEALATYGLQQLRQAAVDGVMGWKYRPYVLNGEPREIRSSILLEFRNGTARRSAIPEMAGIGGVAGMSGMAVGVVGATNDPAPVGTRMPGVPNGPVRVSAGVIAGLLISRPDPVYPPAARAAGVQGYVVLHAILSKTGDVESLQVISGPPMLAGAALDAVRQWKYKPYLLNGQPVEVDTIVNVNFVLATPAENVTPSDTK